MAERTVVDCDKCGKEATQHIRINIPNGSRCGTGSYPETDYLFETKDLCMKCAESLLRFMLGHRCFIDTEKNQVELRADRVHPEGKQETDVIKLARKFFGIKDPKKTN